MKISADPLQPLQRWSELLVREPEYHLYLPRARSAEGIAIQPEREAKSRFALAGWISRIAESQRPR